MKKIGSIILTLGVFWLVYIVRWYNPLTLHDLLWVLAFIVPGLILIIAAQINPIKKTLPFLLITITALSLLACSMSCIFREILHFINMETWSVGVISLLWFAFVIRKKKPDYDMRSMCQKSEKEEK